MSGVEELVPSIYGAALGRLDWPEVMSDLARGVGAIHASVDFRDGTPPAGNMHTDGFDDLLADYLASGWYDDDPRNALIAGMTSGASPLRVVSDAHVRRRYPEALDRFREAFPEPRGHGDYAATVLRLGGRTAVLGFIRSSEAEFSPADLRRISAIGTHLEASLLLAERTGAPADVSTLVAAFEETGATAMFLSGQKRVVAATEAASSLFTNGVTLVDGRLRFNSASNQLAYDELLADPSETGNVRRFLIDDAAPFLVHASSIRDTDHRGAADGVETILSFAPLKPDAATVARVEAALANLGLSPAEAKVAAAVGTGSAPAEAAANLGLTDLTVRSYLKRAYCKLGIARQSELVVLCGCIRQF